MEGRLFFVVGPSGSGKDTLLNGAKLALAADPHVVFAQRVITRPAGVGNEDHMPCDMAEFERRAGSGDFLIHWSAHGLRYGIPIHLADNLASGQNVVINGSRAAAAELVGKARNVTLVEISAPAELIAQRLMARGREDAAQVQSRLARVTPKLPAGIDSVVIHNDAAVETGVARLVSILTSSRPGDEASPVRPASLPGAAFLRAKLNGEELTESQYRLLLTEFVEHKHSESDMTRFLVAATGALSIAEVTAIAKVRSEFAERVTWDEPIVVDKHSLGGVPGSRITMIVVPIVAAHGLAMPKASSRAITSAAGTADAMETVARVDLDIHDVRRVVAAARGCIVWNGKLNHSALDDVMNSITRPLKLDSVKWSVASILSKKVSAGVTHVVVDLPYGPYAKLKTEQQAIETADLLRTVGEALGLKVEACPSPGDQPIGRGIGPALEVRDVMAVLEGRPDAPDDLRNKALAFASRILRWAPDISSEAAAKSRAVELLGSGAAKQAFDRIIDAQGRRAPAAVPGAMAAEVPAKSSGTVCGINGWRIGEIARATGAPWDFGGGLELRVRTGEQVKAGDALYTIRSNTPNGLAAATAAAASDSGFEIA
ncbi:phosphonate metabolism protein/1,5-bisphosphokinase (PRPP-forming) PhnN [Rhodoplanes sp. Z2-YC6860]|uniref:phosphonate metabolism protein/1,5-bisphosphokinase (PRPP-forming) PhnN n=1 Tax=Rhodoplanes sp. Z2-YC6860 TaxID=674703 RepID=UPI00078C1486|nr:phosphonate metabolism protein/1,5-bisphosphokinase (PRPP-forming) PhnN [Rhodoplanes sp. Z2-YC6860]AMN43862.1 thymidine phosphorylase [Rhodoplanes sp. Z2-YC6860]